MQRNGTDNQVELRAAVNAAVRANIAIYPVDSRGLQAIVPGGSARQASRGGVQAFSGRGVANQFTTLSAQQETLSTLASDTGGTAFTDTNDFGEAFTKVVKDISSYYILGFASSNTNKDGRFRRVTVRLKNKPGTKLEAREGYYADRDFTHTAKTDRETLLQEQLLTQIPATDVPLFVTAGWFRLAADKYYVPVSLSVPGSAVPPSKDKVTLDVAGFIRDERGFPVGKIRDTLTVPPANAEGLAARQVLYQTGVTLPPGRFSLKVVVRENTTGQMGTFETPIVVPELKNASVRVSSVVLSTQLQNAAGRKTVSPLVRDGVELVPNLTHIVGRDQKLYFYYEVYEPGAENGAAAAANEPRLLPRQGEGVRDAGRRSDADRRRGSSRGNLPVRGAGGQLQARAVHVSGQHHRRGGGKVRVPAARALRAVSLQGQLGYSPNIDTQPSQRS